MRNLASKGCGVLVGLQSEVLLGFFAHLTIVIIQLALFLLKAVGLAFACVFLRHMSTQALRFGKHLTTNRTYSACCHLISVLGHCLRRLFQVKEFLEVQRPLQAFGDLFLKETRGLEGL